MIAALEADVDSERLLGNRTIPSLAQDPPRASMGARRRWYTAGMYSLTTLLVFADQNLMAPNLSAIASDFNMSDEEKDVRLGGDIAAAFFLVGTPVSLMVGYLTDKVSRRHLFFAVVLFGEVPCLLTIWVTPPPPYPPPATCPFPFACLSRCLPNPLHIPSCPGPFLFLASLSCF
ncbi:hypothetical protein CYMTET_25032 [Cymbomonas tetramitiformis]|uniref:Major facilitator superfamily (MFS) profile domain-containing protein n=1 Tax=Cymbomonas tetramitiformis TaxID=36881 RepID=A0AAE0FV05_9CHLO|nr:hypothetical protein CYMTET_25032 [Cymbomonas tetramitiformis]